MWFPFIRRLHVIEKGWCIRNRSLKRNLNLLFFDKIESNREMLFSKHYTIVKNHSKKGVSEVISEKVNDASSLPFKNSRRAEKNGKKCQRYEKENFPKLKRSCNNRRGFGSSPADWTAREDHRNHIGTASSDSLLYMY